MLRSKKGSRSMLVVADRLLTASRCTKTWRGLCRGFNLLASLNLLGDVRRRKTARLTGRMFYLELDGTMVPSYNAATASI